MFYEDVALQTGETVLNLVKEYGYRGTEWQRIWSDPRNAALVSRRRVPERLQIGDILQVPIKWTITMKMLTGQTNGARMIAERDGELGERLTWVQTVYQHNQPASKTTSFCVDGCPADDNEPFYYTSAETKSMPNLRKRFEDYPQRKPPTAANGTTKWRAVLSLGVVTGRRVTIWNSLVWGWDMTPANNITTIGPRAARAQEVAGHLNLLRNGRGTGPLTFGKAGWTFRSAP